MPYSPYYPGGFKDWPDVSTPITAAALNAMETGITGAGGGSGSGLPWAFYQTSSASCVSDTNWHAMGLTIQDSSSTSILDTGTGPDSVAGIQFVAAGLYVILGSVEFISGSPAAGSGASARWVTTAYYPFTSPYSAFKSSAVEGNSFADPSVSALVNVGPSGDFAAGTTINVEINQNSGGTISGRVTSNVLVVQITATGSSNF